MLPRLPKMCYKCTLRSMNELYHSMNYTTAAHTNLETIFNKFVSVSKLDILIMIKLKYFNFYFKYFLLLLCTLV